MQGEKNNKGKENKGISIEKMVGFKKLKLKKEKRKKEKKKEDENSTELQKPNIEAEVYDNNRRYDWGKKKAQKLN